MVLHIESSEEVQTLFLIVTGKVPSIPAEYWYLTINVKFNIILIEHNVLGPLQSRALYWNYGSGV